jgi:hypothetical protein
VQEDRARLGVRLGAVERAIGEHELVVALGDQAQAMTARVRDAFCDADERRLAVRVGAPVAEPPDVVGGDALDAQGHVVLLGSD